MPTEITARTGLPQSDAPTEGDYEAFCEALSASARGRSFLAEYARRNRNADTEQLLAVIENLQATVAISTSPEARGPIKVQLRGLLDEIGAAQRDIEASVVAMRASRLAELVATVEVRIMDIMATPREEPESQSKPEESVQSRNPDEMPERSHLAVVPTPDQPELPIPSPLAAQSPTISLVRSETIMAEVTFIEASGTPVAPPPAAINPAAVTIEMPVFEAVSNEKSTALVEMPGDAANPLASIMALKEEERLALFT